jgi:phage terminase small subunit
MTDKQKRFVEEYLIDLNATQAAIRAGYSPDTAEVQGYQLLQKTSVSSAMSKAIAERSQ